MHRRTAPALTLTGDELKLAESILEVGGSPIDAQHYWIHKYRRVATPDELNQIGLVCAIWDAIVSADFDGSKFVADTLHNNLVARR